jgi:threonine dehydrogenase-like Zn-dependent dehydrogenase
VHAVGRVDEHPDEVIEPRIRVAEGLGPGLQYQRGQPVTHPLGRPLVLVLGGTGMAGLLAAQNARVRGAKQVSAAGPGWPSARVAVGKLGGGRLAAWPSMIRNSSSVSSC